MSEIVPSFSCEILFTEDCNLRCVYCYENNTRCNNSYMSFDTAKKSADFIFDYALNNGIRFVSWTFFGGEPLLNLDIMVKFFRYALDKANKYNIKSSFSLITNGTIYNKQFEEFILEWYEATKCVNIQISIDGIPEIQDRNRAFINGQATSGIVLSNILKLKKFMEGNNIDYRSSFHTHSVITKDSISKLFLSYKYFRDIGIDHIEFMPAYNENWEERDIYAYIEQLSLIAEYVYSECIEACSLIPYEKANLIIGLRTPAQVNKNKYRQRLFRECAIIPNGDIYTLANIYFYNGSFKLGNVFDGTINDNSKKTFFDACQSNTSSNDNTCFNCGNTECNKYLTSNRFKYNEAKRFFIVEAKKKFDKLSCKLNYTRCSEMTFIKTINQ